MVRRPGAGRVLRDGTRRAGRAVALAIGLGLVAALAAAQDEVPFVTTPDPVTLAMLELADVGPARSRRRPRLGRRPHRHHRGEALRRARPRRRDRRRARASEPRARRAAGVEGRVEFREQDLFKTDLAGGDASSRCTCCPRSTCSCGRGCSQLAPGTRIVSHDWDLGDWTPDRTVDVDVPEKAIGRDKLSRVHLWVVPARVHGLLVRRGRREPRDRRSASSASRRRSPGPAATRRAAVFDGRIDRDDAAGRRRASRSTLRLDGPTLRLQGSGTGLGSASIVRARARRGVPVSGVELPRLARDRDGAVDLPGARDRPHRRHRDAVRQPRPGRAADLGPRSGAAARAAGALRPAG